MGTLNYALLQKYMKKARTSDFLNATQLNAGDYEATLKTVTPDKEGKRMMFIYSLDQGGSVIDSYQLTEEGISYMAQMLTRFTKTDDISDELLKGLVGTRVMLKVTHDASGQYLRIRVLAILAKGDGTADAGGDFSPEDTEEQTPAPKAKKTPPAKAGVQDGDAITVRYENGNYEGTHVTRDGKAYLVTEEFGEFPYNADQLMSHTPKAVTPEAPAPKVKKPKGRTEELGLTIGQKIRVQDGGVGGKGAVYEGTYSGTDEDGHNFIDPDGDESTFEEEELLTDEVAKPKRKGGKQPAQPTAEAEAPAPKAKKSGKPKVGDTVKINFGGKKVTATITALNAGNAKNPYEVDYNGDLYDIPENDIVG